MPESAASPGNVYGVHKQASFLKLSTPVSSTCSGHVLFPTGTHIGTFTKFSQQGFGDSQQSLSLLNTKSSLIMRKAVLQFKILVGKWEYLLILWPPKTSNVDLFPSLLNLSPTKLEWSASSLSLSLPSVCGKPILDYTQGGCDPKDALVLLCSDCPMTTCTSSIILSYSTLCCNHVCLYLIFLYR